MVTIANEQPCIPNKTQVNSSTTSQEVEGLIKQLVKNEIAHFDLATHLFLPNKLMTHTKEVGINPLVDSANYLFSIIGKLAQIPSYRYLNKLHDELIQEIKNFKKTAKGCYHNAQHMIEHLPIACYTLCITLDNTIANLPWGQGEWLSQYSLINVFYPDTLSRESFIAILERTVYHPAIYIDVMEFIYLCLSLGIKGRQFATFTSEEQEYMMNILYKHIRIYRGAFSKSLSPNPLKLRSTKLPSTDEASLFSGILPFLLIISLVMMGGLLFAHHLFQNSTHHIQHHLLQIVKSNRILTVNTSLK